MVNNSDNRQYSSDGKDSIPGVFHFENIQQGIYYLAAEKEGHTGYAIVKLNNNLAIRFVVIPDFYYVHIDLPPPTPSPNP